MWLSGTSLLAMPTLVRQAQGAPVGLQWRSAVGLASRSAGSLLDSIGCQQKHGDTRQFDVLKARGVSLDLWEVAREELG